VRTKAAAYLRVSTDNQSTENQRPELEQLARARGLDVVRWYQENESAAKRRPVFDQVLADAHAGRFAVLLIWALDRFGRSMAGNVNAVLELDRKGVRVVSVREPWLDVDGPVRPLLIAIFSWVAEQERAQLIARTRAGLERAKAKGIRLGRPTKRVDVARARRLLNGGASLRAVARELRVPVATLHRALERVP
jgi:putative DNA-invertase from lambdoid prophage Rac